MTNLRDKLLKIQMKVYRKNLRLIRETVGPWKAASYAREYEKQLQHYREVSSKHELLKRVMVSDIVYHGDYHTLRQSQRSVLRVLREIVGKRQIILCLEMFYVDDQGILDSYMKGKIEEKVFLKKIDYAHKWGFKWENWQPIIMFCRQQSIPVLGINTNPETLRYSLPGKDVAAAKIVGKTIIRNPGKLIYVVDGDYHIAPGHLPDKVDKNLQVFDVKAKRTIIYQNADKLYWQLAKEKKEETDVLKITEDSFCIMNTIPANKLQSYLNWIEFMDDAYYPVHKNWADMPDGPDVKSVSGLAKTICAILDMEFPKQAVSRLSVYYADNLEFLRILEEKKELAPIRSYANVKISRNEGFLLVYTCNGVDNYMVYLPNSSLNMAAEEAAHFIHSVARGNIRCDNSFDRFYCLTMYECIGFFGSKLINEKRKANTSHAIRQFLRQFKNRKPTREEKDKISVAHLILKHHYSEKQGLDAHEFRKKFNNVYCSRSTAKVVLSTQLGYVLGDKLFNAVKKGKISLKDIRALFKVKLELPGKAFLTYLDMNKRIRRINSRNKLTKK